MGNCLAPAVNKYGVCVPTAILNGDPLPEECECMNFTGGCDGADALGAAQSITHGHGVAHLLASNNRLGAQAKSQSAYVISVPKAVQNHPRMNAALREALVQRGIELSEKNLTMYDESKRNALQVRCSIASEIANSLIKIDS